MKLITIDFQRLNGIMNGLEELDRRITMQLDMLEI